MVIPHPATALLQSNWYKPPTLSSPSLGNMHASDRQAVSTSHSTTEHDFAAATFHLCVLRPPKRLSFLSSATGGDYVGSLMLTPTEE